MSCYRCGTRQVDPDRGESPWKRGVRGDRQVLICPGCQAAFDWMSELDRCPVCSGVRLVRRLGEVECKECGSVREPDAGPPGGVVLGASAEFAPGALAPAGGSEPPLDAGAVPGLAEEVELALARVLGRAGSRPARIGENA